MEPRYRLIFLLLFNVLSLAANARQEDRQIANFDLELELARYPINRIGFLLNALLIGSSEDIEIAGARLKEEMLSVKQEVDEAPDILEVVYEYLGNKVPYLATQFKSPKSLTKIIEALALIPSLTGTPTLNRATRLRTALLKSILSLFNSKLAARLYLESTPLVEATKYPEGPFQTFETEQAVAQALWVVLAEGSAAGAPEMGRFAIDWVQLHPAVPNSQKLEFFKQVLNSSGIPTVTQVAAQGALSAFYETRIAEVPSRFGNADRPTDAQIEFLWQLIGSRDDETLSKLTAIRKLSQVLRRAIVRNDLDSLYAVYNSPWLTRLEKVHQDIKGEISALLDYLPLAIKTALLKALIFKTENSFVSLKMRFLMDALTERQALIYTDALTKALRTCSEDLGRP